MADGSIIIDSELNDKGLEKGIKNLQGKLEGAGKKLRSIGGSLTKNLTLPLTAAAGFAVKLGMDFEQGMAQVAAVSGATAQEMEAMEAQARELGSTTKYSALQAAEGMEFLARAGFSANEVMAAMPGLLDLAAASGTELGVAADIASNILSGFGMEAGEAGRVANVLALATASSNTSVESMGEAMKYVAPVASAMGISVEDTAAAVGLLGDAGIAGGQAGTVLRKGLLSLASPAAGAADMMEELGLEVFDAEGNMKALPDVISELENGLEGMSAQQKTAALETLFGAQAVSGWSALIDAGSDSLGEFTGDLNNAEGAAAEMAAIMGDTTKGRLLELKSAIEEVALQLFEALQPAIEAAIGWLTDLAAWFNGLSDEQVSTIAMIGAVVAAVGPLIGILGTIIIVISKVVGAFALITPPVLLVIGIIGAVIAIGVQLYKHWDTIKAKAIEVFSHFKPLLEVVKAAFQNLMDSVGPIMESLKTLWQSLIPILEKIGVVVGAVVAVAFGILIGVFNGVVAAIGPIINALINFVDFAVNMVNAIVALFTGDFAGAWQYLQDAGQSTIDFFVNLFTGLIDFVVGFVDAIIGFFHGLYMALVGNSIIPDMVNAIVDWFKNMFQWVIDIVMMIVDGIVDAFMFIYETVSNYIEMVWEIIQSVWDYIKQTFENALAFIVALVTGDFQGMRDAINAQMENVKKLLENIWKAIDSFLTKTLGGIWDTVKNIFGNIFSTISSILGNIRNTISNIWNGIRNTISSVLNGIRSVVSNVWNGIRNTISNVVNGIRNTISNIFNSLKGIVSNAFNAVRNAVSNGIKGALNVVTNMAKNFFNAGKNIVTSIADGITGAIGKVTDAIGNVAGKIRNFLPFSPAKEGPLTDIDKLNFDGPIEDSLDDAIPDVQAKLNTLLTVPKKEPDFPGGKGYKEPAPRVDEESRTIQVTSVVNVDGEEITRVVYDPINARLGDDMDLQAYLKGDR